MATGLSDLISGLREAEDEYRSDSAQAFAGIEPAICGMVEVLPMTPKMFIDLDGADNAFFSRKGKLITVGDVAAFLWRCSPHYTFGKPESAGIRSFFNANLYVLPYDQSVDEIYAYITRAWAGMPLWKSKVSAERGVAQWPSRLVHMFGSAYHWTESETLNLPFRRLWQYANRVLESHDPEYKEQCSAVLKLRAEWLTKFQAELDAAKAAEGGRNSL